MSFEKNPHLWNYPFCQSAAAPCDQLPKVTAATALLHFTEKGGILQEFDDDLFNEYVNRIIVRSRNEVRFELKCGLTLRERM